jgi:hypothetical protein
MGKIAVWPNSTFHRDVLPEIQGGTGQWIPGEISLQEY